MTTRTPQPLITRRSLVRAGMVAGGAAVLGGGAYGVSRLVAPGPEAFLASWRVADGADGAARHFHSAPGLTPATVYDLAGNPPRTTGEYLFAGPAAIGGAQSGPMIMDNTGEPVWCSQVTNGGWLTNFATHTYRGEPVLIWWEGRVLTGYGFGEAVILDRSYREIARVRGANGHHVDLHELTLTDRGTALFTCPPVTTPRDLSAIGGSAGAAVRESIFQEVDVATGRLVREWRSLGHVDPSESYRSPDENFDYMHLNSIVVTADGNLIVSGRHTWALYKLHRATGAVMWRLGGKRTQFDMGRSTQFAWQHDGRMPSGSLVTVFDNGDDGRTKTHPTRGLALTVHERARRVTLKRANLRQHQVDATAMGSARHLGNGHMAVGWGSAPYVSEFDAGGDVLVDLRIGTNPDQKSYRTLRHAWSGRPHTRPAVVGLRDRSTDTATLYVSWNGATDVAHWRIEAGTRRSDLRRVGAVPRRGFETAVNLGTEHGYAAVVAIDAHGRVLRRSATVAI
jgi:hypothetical protein